MGLFVLVFGPFTYSVLLVDVFQATDFTRDAHGQASVNTALDVALVHVLERSSRRRLSKVHRLVVSIGISDHDKTAAANTRVIHSHSTNTKGRADKGIDSISLEDV